MVGINGTNNSKKFDGKCVNTIVFKSPKRRAIARFQLFQSITPSNTGNRDTGVLSGASN
jgi:hypothetical protein